MANYGRNQFSLDIEDELEKAKQRQQVYQQKTEAALAAARKRQAAKGYIDRNAEAIRGISTGTPVVRANPAENKEYYAHTSSISTPKTSTGTQNKGSNSSATTPKTTTADASKGTFKKAWNAGVGEFFAAIPRAVYNLTDGKGLTLSPAYQPTVSAPVQVKPLVDQATKNLIAKADYSQAEFAEAKAANAEKGIGGKAKNLLADVVYTIPSLIPDLIVSIGSMGTVPAYKGVQLSQEAANAIKAANTAAKAQSGLRGTIKALGDDVVSAVNKNAPTPGSMTYRTIRYGAEDINEAMADGASKQEALQYALLDAPMSALIESGGGVDTAVKTAARGTSRGFLNGIKTVLRSGLEEGMEGGAQDVLSALAQKNTYDQDKAWIGGSDAVFSPLRTAQAMGTEAVGGLLLGGATRIPGMVLQRTWQPSPQPATETTENSSMAQTETGRSSGRTLPGRTASFNATAMSKSQARTITSLGNYLGTKVRIVPHGSLTNGDNIADGLYDPKTNEILIDEKTADPVMAVMKHEITHRMRNLSEDAYQRYERFVVEQIVSGEVEYTEAARQTILDIFQLYRQNDNTFRMRHALEEFMANYTINLLKDEKAIRKLCREDMNLAQQLYEWVKDMLAALQDAMKGQKGWQETITGDYTYGLSQEKLKNAENIFRSALQEAHQALATGKNSPTDKKRTLPLLRTIGFQMPIELQQSGSIGSISYNGNHVKMTGVPMQDILKPTAFTDGLNENQETVYNIGVIRKRSFPRVGSSGFMPGAHVGSEASLTGNSIFPREGKSQGEISSFAEALQKAQEKQRSNKAKRENEELINQLFPAEKSDAEASSSLLAEQRNPKVKYLYAGQKALTSDKKKLELAQQMEQQGYAPEDIRQQTGWFRSMDGKWRFEIDDSEMKYQRRGDLLFRERNKGYNRYRELTEKDEAYMLGKSKEWLTEAEQQELKNLSGTYGTAFRQEGRISPDALPTTRLSDYLQHDELFKAYPQLKNVNLVFQAMPEENRGKYDAGRNTITVNSDLRHAPEDVLIHEIQHAIQQAEGFTNGSSPEAWKNRLNQAHLRTMEARYAFQNSKAVAELIERIASGELDEELYDEELDRILARNSDAREKYNAMRAAERFENQMIGTGISSIDLYRNTAGEIEARDTAARRSMGPEERSKIRPDIGNENTVFYGYGFPDGNSMDYVGHTADGTEVYETSEEVRKLPYSARRKLFANSLANEYRGRTAKFTTKDGETYYAKFDDEDIRKNIYGDKRSSQRGKKAKINVGADGNIFELVENARYKGSQSETGKPTKAHKGVSGWAYFVKTVQIDGRVYDLLANIRKKPDGEYIYSIQLNENQKKTPAPPLAPAYTSDETPDGYAQNGVLTDVLKASIADNGPWVNDRIHRSLTQEKQRSSSAKRENEELLNQLFPAEKSDAEASSSLLAEQRNPKVKYLYAGQKALTSDKKKLELAQQMEQQGYAPEDIRQQTGWFRSMDGKWRFEIDDSEMKFDATGMLRGNRDFPQALTTMRASWQDALLLADDKQKAQLSAYQQALETGDTQTAENLYQQLVKSHKIGPYVKDYAKAIEQINHPEKFPQTKTLADYVQHDLLFSAYPQMKDLAIDFDLKDNNNNAVYNLLLDGISLKNNLPDPRKTLIHELQHGIQSIEGFSNGAVPMYWANKEGKTTPEKRHEDMAWNTAGEIEARDAARRRNLPEAARLGTPPYLKTENVFFADYDLEKEKKQRLTKYPIHKVNGHFISGTVPEPLTKLGIREGNVYWPHAKLSRILNNYPELTPNSIQKIFGVLEQPTMVIKPQTGEDIIYLFGKVEPKNEEPFVTTLALKIRPYTGVEIENIFLWPGYNSTPISIRRLMENNEILYLDPERKKTNAWLTWLNMPSGVKQSDYGPLGEVTYEDGQIHIRGPILYGSLAPKEKKQGTLYRLFPPKD